MLLSLDQELIIDCYRQQRNVPMVKLDSPRSNEVDVVLDFVNGS